MAGVPINRTVVAFVPEATEGTLLAPSAATQYSAIQADWTVDPGRNTIVSEELRDSIAESKAIPGGEDPTCSGSHYMRASGVAGTAPDYNDLMKALFGSEVVASTEYDLVAGSTTTVLNVDSGEGANFQRGQGLLIKDDVNGWRVRPVKSVATDALTIPFALPTAPAAGVLTGKAVLWKPANSAHQTLSVWTYHANGGAVEAVAGCRVTGWKLSASAAQLPNGTFSLAGLSHYLNPIEITASTCNIDFTDDDVTDQAATIPLGWYRSPHELAAAAQAAMRSANSGETHTVVYSNSTGKFTFTSTGTVLSLLWATGTNNATAAFAKFGFADADATGTAASTGYTSATAYTLTSPYTPTLDTVEVVAAKDQEVMVGDSADYTCFDTPSVDLDMVLGRAIQESLCSRSGRLGSIITKRTTTIAIKQFLTTYDANLYNRMQEGTTTQFVMNIGRKTAGRWVPGEVFGVYAPTCTVEGVKITSQDGMAVFEATLRTHVGSDLLGEIYAYTV